MTSELPIETNFVFPYTSREPTQLASSIIQLHRNAFTKNLEYFASFSYDNAEVPDINYETVPIVADQYAFVAVLPDVIYEQRFYISQKYRTHLYAIYAVLLSSELENINFELRDKRIFDYFNTDIARFVEEKRLNPAVKSKNPLANADILLDILRLFEGKHIVFSLVEEVDKRAINLLQLGQFSADRLHDVVYETSLKNPQEYWKDGNENYDYMNEPIAKSAASPNKAIVQSPTLKIAKRGRQTANDTVFDAELLISEELMNNIENDGRNNEPEAIQEQIKKEKTQESEWTDKEGNKQAEIAVDENVSSEDGNKSLSDSTEKKNEACQEKETLKPHALEDKSLAIDAVQDDTRQEEEQKRENGQVDNQTTTEQTEISPTLENDEKQEETILLETKESTIANNANQQEEEKKVNIMKNLESDIISEAKQKCELEESSRNQLIEDSTNEQKIMPVSPITEKLKDEKVASTQNDQIESAADNELATQEPNYEDVAEQKEAFKEQIQPVQTLRIKCTTEEANEIIEYLQEGINNGSVFIKSLK